jgi:3-dehydro-L-gulonate 2-dehydrogenase
VATVLSGGSSTQQIGQRGSDEYGMSQMFIALDATRIAGEANLASVVNEIIENVHGSECVDAEHPVLYPGARSLAFREANLALGIPVDEAVWATIKSL